MATRDRHVQLLWLEPHDLRGKNLRYALLTVLAEQGPGSIAELRRRLERLGLVIGGEDPAKTVSDVLRYECAKGRVSREARGRYRAGIRPDTTRRRHRDRLRDLVQEGDRRRARGITQPGGGAPHARDSS